MIQYVSARLAPLSYAEIRFILEQFGVGEPTGSFSDTYEFSLNALKVAAPAQLFALRKHFTGSTSTTPTTSTVWGEKSFRLFMSHITADKVMVGQVKEALERRGISAFVAHEDIKPTKKWEEEIEKALATCDALVAFVTPDFHSSKWTDQEVGYCISRRIMIVPLGLGETPYGFMGKYQGAQCLGLETDQVADKIFDVLMEQALSSAKLAKALVNAFEQSDGFQESRRLILDLQRISTWTPDMLRSIERAVQQNDQVSLAFGVSNKVQTIINKHSA